VLVDECYKHLNQLVEETHPLVLSSQLSHHITHHASAATVPECDESPIDLPAVLTPRIPPTQYLVTKWVKQAHSQPSWCLTRRDG
jgi:hypothetical protein